eukprot:TRINITY_DN4486_c0_g1_i3.p1 TRINITY_DN4486_c0_g1~~TRINITY_DN4486_c0_g1_i3.p1  ORF type:complete len:360 (-),score=44.85 TRINITY_DN4486_c0_g1_i3:112-1191(-)
MRFLAAYMSSTLAVQFWVMVAGQCISAIFATCISLNVISMMAGNWFGEGERSIAASLGFIWNLLGMGLVFGMVPAVVSSDSTGLQYVLVGEAGYLSSLFIIVLLFFQDRPDTPPSAAGCKKDQGEGGNSFLQNIKLVLTNIHYIFLLIGMGGCFGAFQSLNTLLNSVMIPLGFTPQQAGMFGVGIISCGLGGALISGAVLGKFPTAHREIIWSCAFLMTAGMTFFTFMLTPDQYYIALACTCVMGFGALGALPVIFDLAVEITYPVPEGVSTGLITMLGCLFTVAETYIMEAWKDPEPPHSMQKALYWNLGVTIFCAFAITGSNGQYKRRAHEAEESRKFAGEKKVRNATNMARAEGMM